MNLFDLHKRQFSWKAAMEIVNTVADELDMEIKSIGYGGRCSYRGVDGSRCAIGILIPDEKYDEFCDNHGLKVLELIRYYRLDIEPLWILLLEAMQFAHDESKTLIISGRAFTSLTMDKLNESTRLR